MYGEMPLEREAVYLDYRAAVVTLDLLVQAPVSYQEDTST